MAAATFGDSGRRDMTAPWRHVDVAMLACVLGLAVVGVVMVFSATRGNGEVADTTYLKREAAFMVLGVGAMLAMTLVDYRRIFNWVWPIYGGCLILLVLVISPLGQQSKGAQAWFGFGSFQLQPAEFGKLAVILGLAALLANFDDDVDPRRLAVLLLVPGAATVLIMLQPDLGMVLIYVAITMGMLLVGGLPAKYLLALAMVGVIGAAGVLNSNVLQKYQKERLTAFVSPQHDAQGVTYNVAQSQTAIGNGGAWGEGLFNGKQTQLSFVPEQQTDFIFTAVGEELGFAGAATVLGLYGVIVWRIWRTALLAKDLFGRLICAGVLSFLVFQIFENVGMTMQIMPVTGIPLPLLSHGGSSILTAFVALGLVTNIHMRRFR